MGFKMKGSAFKLGNIATKSTLKMKSPLEQEKTKFGYHDEEGNVIADATKDIVPAQQGGGSFTKDRDESGSERATYQKKVGDVVRQTARAKASEKRAEKLKKKRLKGEKREAAKKSKGEKRRLQISVRGFVKPKAKGAGTKMVPSFPTVKVRKVKKGKGGIRVSKF